MHCSDFILSEFRKEMCDQSHWPLTGTGLLAKHCMCAEFLAPIFCIIFLENRQTQF